MTKKLQDKTFINITNHDIYNEILELKKELKDFNENNSCGHSAIISRQDRTNGKVKLSMWIASTALSISLIVVGFFFNFLSK